MTEDVLGQLRTISGQQSKVRGLASPLHTPQPA